MNALKYLHPARRRTPIPIAKLSPSIAPPACLLQPLQHASNSYRTFSTTPTQLARRKKGSGEKRDRRIKLIRYHLFHPILPRPLRLSRTRTLRHWTIHRAWQLFRANQRRAEELSLQKQYQSMQNACEALRLLGEDGLAVQDAPTTNIPQSLTPSKYLQQSGGIVRPPGARDPVARTFLRTKEGGLVAADMPEKAEGRVDKNAERVEIDVVGAAGRQKDVGRLYRIAMEKKGIFQGVPIEYARIQTDTPPRSGWDHEWKRG